MSIFFMLQLCQYDACLLTVEPSYFEAPLARCGGPKGGGNPSAKPFCADMRVND